MFDKVSGDDFDTVLRSYNGFELRPFALELLLALDFLALCDFLELGVDLRALGRFELQLG